jgi:hypothetical protein
MDEEEDKYDEAIARRGRGDTTVGGHPIRLHQGIMNYSTAMSKVLPMQIANRSPPCWEAVVILRFFCFLRVGIPRFLLGGLGSEHYLTRDRVELLLCTLVTHPRGNCGVIASSHQLPQARDHGGFPLK